jgi:hypothetical protein
MKTTSLIFAILFIAIVYGLYTTLSGSSGSILNAQAPQTIAEWAANAGFSGADLVTAVAIAYAESSGDPSAYNPETAANTPEGQGSYGLWQIYLKAHPEFNGLDLYDPQTNANAAFSVYSAAGNSFKPWSTFTSNAFSKYLNQAGNLVAGLSS